MPHAEDVRKIVASYKAGEIPQESAAESLAEHWKAQMKWATDTGVVKAEWFTYEKPRKPLEGTIDDWCGSGISLHVVAHRNARFPA